MVLRRRLLLFLRIFIGIGIIYVIFKYVPYQRIYTVFCHASIPHIILAFFIFFLTYLIGVLRWRFVLSVLDVHLSLREVSYSFFSSLFFNLFSPSLLAGDIFRSVTMTYRHHKTAKVISSVMIDRFSGAVAILLIGLVAFVLGRGLLPQGEVFKAIGIFLWVNLILVVFIFSRAFYSLIGRVFKKESGARRRIENFYREISILKRQPRVLVGSIGYSLVIQLLVCIIFYIIAEAFSVHINMGYFFIFVPIVQYIIAIPVTVAGLGTREAAVVYFLSRVGVDKSVALSISFTVFFFLIIISVGGGVVYALVYHRWLERST